MRMSYQCSKTRKPWFSVAVARLVVARARQARRQQVGVHQRQRGRHRVRHRLAGRRRGAPGAQQARARGLAAELSNCLAWTSCQYRNTERFERLLASAFRHSSS